jgi:hypothetical protein
MDPLEVANGALSSVHNGDFITVRTQLKQLMAYYLSRFGNNARYSAFLSLLRAQVDSIEHIIMLMKNGKKQQQQQQQDGDIIDKPIVILPSTNDVCRFSSIIGYYDVKEKLFENIVLYSFVHSFHYALTRSLK